MAVSRVSLSPKGLEFSRFIAGFWRLKHWGKTPQELLGFIEDLLALGVTTMDHAMVYRSEAPFGDALALKPSLRDKMEIVTKCGIRPQGFGDLGARNTNHYDASPRAIVQSVEASLRDLRTDYVDLLLIHRPDYLLHADEVADTFQQLRTQGKVKFFGVSNFTPSQFELLQSRFNNELVTNQIEFSPAYMAPLENGLLDQASLHKAKPMLWSCLAGGKLLQPEDAKGERILAALQQVARELGVQDIEQVIYAWVLTLPCDPLPLLGSSKIERIRAAVAADGLRLSREQWYSIWEASNGAAVP